MRQRGRISYQLFSKIKLKILLVIVLIVHINYFTKKTENNKFKKKLPELKRILGKQELKLSVQTKDIEETHLTELKTIPENQKLLFSRLSKEIKMKQLINLSNFHYTISNSLCTSYDKDLFAIIIITSYAGNVEIRAKHRRTISQSKLAGLKFQRIFLIAELPEREDDVEQQQLFDEQQKFGDLLQGNFVEDYYNLTYKTIMGLRWAALECSRAKFILKLDDDIVYDIFCVKNYLEALEVKDPANFLAGFGHYKVIPIRDVNHVDSKWYVSKHEFAPDIFPDYVSGGYYMTNPITALRLVHESQQAPFLKIEDVFVLGVLRERIQVPFVDLYYETKFYLEY